MKLPEQFTAKGQVKSRPSIIAICNFLLTEPTLKTAMVEFLTFLNDRGATISWYVTNSYKVKYKSEDLIGIKLGNGAKNTPNTLHFCDGHCCCDYDLTVTTPTQLESTRLYLHEKMLRIETKHHTLSATTSDNDIASEKPAKLSKLDKYLVDFPAGEIKDNITKFITWLRAQRMTPQLFSPNSYKVSHKGTRLCYIRFPHPNTEQTSPRWTVEFVRDGYGHGDAPKDAQKNKMPPISYTKPMDYDAFLDEDAQKSLMLSGLKECSGCYACKPGMPIVIHGKPYQMCKIEFINPSDTTITTLCDILHRRKTHIDASN